MTVLQVSLCLDALVSMVVEQNKVEIVWSLWAGFYDTTCSNGQSFTLSSVVVSYTSHKGSYLARSLFVGRRWWLGYLLFVNVSSTVSDRWEFHC